MMYYLEENIDLDYATIQRFGNLDVSPPTDQSDCEKVNKLLQELRGALELAGQLEQAEGKARFLKDDSHTQTEEYTKMKEEYEALDYALKKKVENIKHMSKHGAKLRLNSFIDEDEDDDEEDFSAEFDGAAASNYTQLRPSNRGRGGGGYGRGDRGGQGKGDRQRNQSRRRDDQDDRQRNQNSERGGGRGGNTRKGPSYKQEADNFPSF